MGVDHIVLRWSAIYIYIYIYRLRNSVIEQQWSGCPTSYHPRNDSNLFPNRLITKVRRGLEGSYRAPIHVCGVLFSQD
jgi:hypothetical protein